MLIELITLSERMRFTGSEPFALRDVHWMIDLDEQGNLVGISPSVKLVVGRHGETKEERGRPALCPTAFYMKVDDKGRVSASFGGGNVPALLGVGRTVEVFQQEVNQEKGKAAEVVEVSSVKDKRRHANFVALHRKFAADYPESKSAAAILRFLEKGPQLIPHQFIPRNEQDSKEPQRTRKGERDSQLAKLNSEYITFRVAHRPLLKDKDFVAWWTKYYDDQRQPVLKVLPQGTDLLSSELDHSGTLARVFPHIAGVPNGGGYCPLASFDKEPSQSYGLGDLTAPMLLENAEMAAAALNWLLREDSTHIRLGSDLVAVFWAVELSKPEEAPKASPFAGLLADPLQVREYFRSVGKGVRRQIDQSTFYAAILSSPQSRVTVRNWHTSTLPEADRHLHQYFLAISLTSHEESEFFTFSIGRLADITIAPRKKGGKAKPPPDTYIALFETAMFGYPLPHKLLTKALQRQSLELSKGTDKQNRSRFEMRLAARSALIKLYFKSTKGVEMTPDKHDIESDAAYLCGRLLAMLDRIHVEAHRSSGGTNSSPANRVYGSASTTPALVFPQLCRLVRHHLNKLGGGMARNLEFGVKEENRTDGTAQDFVGLADIVARLLKTPGQRFPSTLNLEEQGRFALGFYYERSLPLPRTSKQKDSNNGSSDTETSGEKPKGENTDDE